jgi:hypothetical protein
MRPSKMDHLVDPRPSLEQRHMLRKYNQIQTVPSYLVSCNAMRGCFIQPIVFLFFFPLPKNFPCRFPPCPYTTSFASACSMSSLFSSYTLALPRSHPSHLRCPTQQEEPRYSYSCPRLRDLLQRRRSSRPLDVDRVRSERGRRFPGSRSGTRRHR